MSRAGWIAVAVIAVAVCAMFAVMAVAGSAQAHQDMETCLQHGGQWTWHAAGGNQCEGSK